MNDIKVEIAELVKRCHDESVRSGSPTRPVAVAMVDDLPDGPLLRRLAAEFLVDALARAQRAKTLEEERSAERERQTHENPGRMPRKGTRARADWERNTPEGRAWAEAEEAEAARSMQMFRGALGRTLDRYAEDLRVTWTAELLDSTFALGDGRLVTWGDATVEQHAERRQMFLNNAHANLEGAARHELALRELRESGKASLREMVEVAA